MKEDLESWKNFFLWLKERGLSGVRLFVGDKNLGMLETIGEVFPEAKYQRCIVHFLSGCLQRGPSRRDAGSILNAESHPLQGKQRGSTRKGSFPLLRNFVK